MKHNIARTGLAIVFAATLVLSMAATAQAGGPCSLARAAGTYGLTDVGTVVDVGPRTAVGIWTMDAAGNLTNGKGTSSLNGTIARETFSGTYTVNPDCTGTLAVNIFESGNLLFAVTADVAWDDNMREVRFIFTSAVSPVLGPLQTVINGDARKMVP